MRTLNIVLCVQQWVRKTRIDVGLGRKVYDGVDRELLKHLLKEIGIFDITMYEPVVVVTDSEISGISGARVEIIDIDERVVGIGLFNATAKCGPDEPASARN